jgi:hypothetical protein
MQLWARLLFCLGLEALKLDITPYRLSRACSRHALHAIFGSFDINDNMVSVVARLCEYQEFNFKLFHAQAELAGRVELLAPYLQYPQLHSALFHPWKLFFVPELARLVLLVERPHYGANFTEPLLGCEEMYPGEFLVFRPHFEDRSLHKAMVNYIVDNQLGQLHDTGWLEYYLETANAKEHQLLFQRIRPEDMRPDFLSYFLTFGRLNNDFRKVLEARFAQLAMSSNDLFLNFMCLKQAIGLAEADSPIGEEPSDAIEYIPAKLHEHQFAAIVKGTFNSKMATQHLLDMAPNRTDRLFWSVLIFDFLDKITSISLDNDTAMKIISLVLGNATLKQIPPDLITSFLKDALVYVNVPSELYIGLPMAYLPVKNRPLEARRTAWIQEYNYFMDISDIVEDRCYRVRGSRVIFPTKKVKSSLQRLLQNANGKGILPFHLEIELYPTNKLVLFTTMLLSNARSIIKNFKKIRSSDMIILLHCWPYLIHDRQKLNFSRVLPAGWDQSNWGDFTFLFGEQWEQIDTMMTTNRLMEYFNLEEIRKLVDSSCRQ